jgi:hypothetical protein
VLKSGALHISFAGDAARWSADIITIAVIKFIKLVAAISAEEINMFTLVDILIDLGRRIPFGNCFYLVDLFLNTGRNFIFPVYRIARQVIKEEPGIMSCISFNGGLQMVKVYLQLIIKIRNWRRAILLTRYAFFVAVVMVAPGANILCAINSQQWVAPTAVMVAVEPILF